MRLFVLVSLVLLHFVNNVNAQLSQADSAFLNGVYNEPRYMGASVLGNWYVHDSTESVPHMYQQLDNLFPFYDVEFDSAYNNIVLSSDLYYDTVRNYWFNWYYNNNPNSAYKQANPLVQIDFSLNGKSAVSYATLKPAINNTANVGFLIIPGSNNNQTTELNRGIGYHNSNCYVRELLSNYGDVYIHCKPLEDYRALRWNTKRMNSKDYVTPGFPSFAYNYLISLDKNYGLNYLIECLALIKYMRTKYDKIILLGCSQGGYAVLTTSFFAKVEACLVTSGYTITFDDSNLHLSHLSKNFGQYAYLHSKQVIKDKIANANTHYLFSWGIEDRPAYLIEQDSNLTEKYLDNYWNASFFYNYYGHAFPPCSDLDTFVNRIIQKPIAKLYPEVVCNPDSIFMTAVTKGNHPVSFDLFRNDTLLGNYIANSDTIYLSSTSGGVFQIKNVMDSNGEWGYESQRVYKELSTPLLLNNVTQAIDCTKDSIDITLSLQGIVPYIIHSGFQGVTKIDSFYSDTVSYKYPQGNFSLISIIDASKCQLDSPAIAQLNLKHKVMSASVDSFYSCSDNKIYLTFHVNGTPPFAMYYEEDGIPYTFTIPDTVFEFALLPDKQYVFEKLQDSNNCELPLNYSYYFDFNLATASLNTIQYNCNTNLVDVSLDLQGDAPFVMNYTDQSSSYLVSIDSVFHFPNGNFFIHSIADSKGCESNIGQWVQHNFLPLNASIISSDFQCDQNKWLTTISMTGNVPFTLYYRDSINNISNTQLTYDTNYTFVFEKGYYVLDSIKDITNCRYTFNHHINHNKDSLDLYLFKEFYHCDSMKTNLSFKMMGQPPFTLSYTELNSGISTSVQVNQDTLQLLLPNGTYQFYQLDDATCSIPISIFRTFNYSPLLGGISNPVYNCEDELYEAHIGLMSGTPPFVLSFTKDNIQDSIVSNLFFQKVTFDTGEYYFYEIKDANQCKLPLNNLMSLHYEKIKFNDYQINHLCFKDSIDINIDFASASATELYYKVSSGFIQKTQIDQSNKIRFPYGDIELIYIKDQMGCIDSIVAKESYVYNHMNNPLVVLDTNCVEKKYTAYLNVHGDLPVQWYLTNNTPAVLEQTTSQIQSMNLSNGVFLVDKIVDKKGCALPISFSANLPSFAQHSPVINRDHRKVFVQDSFYRYQWYYNGVLYPDYKLSTMPLLNNGQYAVVAYDSAGCVYNSDIVSFSANDYFTIAPNPANDYTIVYFSNHNIAEHWEIELMDLSGKVLGMYKSSSFSEKIDLSPLSTGIYQLVIYYSINGSRLKAGISSIRKH